MAMLDDVRQQARPYQQEIRRLRAALQEVRDHLNIGLRARSISEMDTAMTDAYDTATAALTSGEPTNG